MFNQSSFDGNLRVASREWVRKTILSLLIGVLCAGAPVLAQQTSGDAVAPLPEAAPAAAQDSVRNAAPSDNAQTVAPADAAPAAAPSLVAQSAAPSDPPASAAAADASQPPALAETAQTPAAADQAPAAASGAAAPAAAPAPAQATPAAPATPAKPAVTASRAKTKKSKEAYTGPTNIVVLAPTPMVDGEGKQRIDPDGKPMFNAPVKQIRDKKGHPVFDPSGKPVFETATNLGYDERGKKIPVKKIKPQKMTPLSVSAGTLTVDGWTGKARLNYDIADLKFLYIYAPSIGTTIVSQNPFPGAKEQAAAFNGKTLHVTVDGHPIELYSEKLLLGKKPHPAWVVVDRSFLLPAKFPVFGYGVTTKSPYAWPGAKNTVVAQGAVKPPALPVDLRPTLQLTACPVGMMRQPGPVVLPGQKAPDQPCVPINSPSVAGTAAPAARTP